MKKKETSDLSAGDCSPAIATVRISADLHSPVSLFLRLGGDGPAFLLESAEGESGRYSFLGFDPMAVLTCRPQETRISWADGREETGPGNDPVKVLDSLMMRFRLPESTGLPPFWGGAVGYLSYEAVSFWETIPLGGGRHDDLPTAQFIIPGTVVALDRLTGVMTLIRFDLGGDKKRAAQVLSDLLETLSSSPTPLALPADPSNGDISWDDSLDQPAFEKAVVRVLDDIRAGEILQAVLSLCRTADYTEDPFTVYRYLRLLNPSPYLFFLRLPDVTLAGSSPEMMVQLSGNRLTLKPIAGTRPRGSNPAEDDLLQKELTASEKDRAEHAMLVDLGRNDLGRVAVPGSVKVEKVMEVESFSHVHHLVSRISAQLRPGLGVGDLVRSTFPAGTVSGAPKIRAMEIIAREEPGPRGPYAGMVAYYGFSGNFDSAIVIRSAVFADGRVRVQAGAGIVADSDPGAEYQEIISKSAVVAEAIRRAKGGTKNVAAGR